MNHCSHCWLKDKQIARADYIYDGTSMCRLHLQRAYDLLVGADEEPAPKKKPTTKKKPTKKKA